MSADDKPKPLKKGSIPYSSMWKEENVRDYLRLPRLPSMEGKVGLSIDEIARRVETLQRLAGFEPVKDHNRPFKLSGNEFPVVIIELRREVLPVLRVSVYDYRSWNDLCDKLFRYVTTTVQLWNTIPDYYAIEESTDAYTLTRKSGISQKWHFALQNLYVIAVDAGHAPESVRSEDNARTEIDRVIRELVGIIEGKHVSGKQDTSGRR